MAVYRFSGEEMRRRREALGVAPEVVAVGVGRCLSMIWSYETGRNFPPAIVVARLAEVLGCSPGDLFVVDDVVAIPA